MDSQNILLQVKDLRTHFFLREGTVKAVDGVDFTLTRGSTVGIVGESGCGKSVMAYSILQLIGKPGRIVSGEILFDRSENGTPDMVDLAAFKENSPQLRAVRGKDISLIFQEPMNSLSPVHTIGDQITEGMLLHTEMNKAQAWARRGRSAARGRHPQAGRACAQLHLSTQRRDAPARHDRRCAGVQPQAADRR